ncbi:alpha/beta fold hydrolase [Testudinibacter aquarius]|uniref:Alpha/beta hydrolase n=1 Tax=Testudinibacter aquarius TaxID=1524974 RepID=A0A4R3YFT8_9PAST|nr:alpha/beta hydrolase [Testudinibacter aquarius]KAE9529860.1 hydrolase [Testudinibacter aquarius]TCV89373.1 lysophospholipase [Testudinibacter aquarius]TNG93153.1 alpha/beta hydrolase [Testudinibacter aquarius]
MEREPHFGQFALRTLKPFAEQFPLQYLDGQRGCKIAYRFFEHPAQDLGARKLMLLVSGRAENVLKWTEIAYDFYQQGFDVLAFDHRGQGYSQRLLRDPEKGHIDRFDYYLDDLDAVLHSVNQRYAYQQQVMLAHSMGGLIATLYLAKYPHQFDKLILNAPLFALPLKNPWLDPILVSLMMLLGQGQRYVFGHTAYKPINPEHNDLSCCKTRMKWHNRINRRFSELHLGGPTFRWAHLFLLQFNKLPRAIGKIQLPVLLLQAEKEVVVSNRQIEDYAKLFHNLRHETIHNAKHEILFERDPIRTLAMEKIRCFLG